MAPEWITFEDNEVREFTDLLKSLFDKRPIEITTSVMLNYLGIYHGSDIGSLDTSCMRHGSCSSYMSFYEKNGVKLAVMKDDNDLLIGRALIWETDKGTVMDRIYGNDITISKFIQYAVNNNWWHKEYQASSSGMFKLGDKYEDGFTVKLKDTGSYDYYPYCDSFKYLDTSKKTLTTIDPGTNCVLLESTDGGCGELGCYCYECDTYHRYDDITYIMGDAFCPNCCVYDTHTDMLYKKSDCSVDYRGCYIPNNRCVNLVDGTFGDFQYDSNIVSLGDFNYANRMVTDDEFIVVRVNSMWVLQKDFLKQEEKINKLSLNITKEEFLKAE